MASITVMVTINLFNDPAQYLFRALQYRSYSDDGVTMKTMFSRMGDAAVTCTREKSGCIKRTRPRNRKNLIRGGKPIGRLGFP